MCTALRFDPRSCSWSWPGVSPAAAQQAYQIGQGDILKVAVWSQPELSGEFTVDVGRRRSPCR